MTYFSRIIIILLILLLTNTESTDTSKEACDCDPFASFVKYCGADKRMYDGCQIKCQKIEILSIGPCPEKMKMDFRRRHNLQQPIHLFKKTLGKNISVVFK